MRKVDNVEFFYDATTMFAGNEKFQFAREPTLRRMPDGALASLVYTGGVREPSVENVVAFIRSEDDGATWSEPDVIFSHPRRPCWGTELFIEGELPMIVFQTYDFASNYCELRAFYATTSDCGHTWSSPKNLPGIPCGFSVRQGKELSDGSWIFPVYWQEVRRQWDFCCGDQPENSGPEDSWLFVAGVIRSTDRGRSFSLHGGISPGEHLAAWEPEIAELSPGHLRMWIRCECPQHVLWESDSFDCGKSWTPPRRSTIPNPGTKMVVYSLHGRLIMVNNVCAPNDAKRDRLEIWVSQDQGKSWGHKIPVARLMPEGAGQGDVMPQVAYPHGFMDEERQTFYLAIDSIKKFFLVKIPFADLLKV